MLALVDFIAGRLGKEFPNVAFDTLAYQYTRKAPKDIQALPNVIVIEMDDVNDSKEPNDGDHYDRMIYFRLYERIKAELSHAGAQKSAQLDVAAAENQVAKNPKQSARKQKARAAEVARA